MSSFEIFTARADAHGQSQNAKELRNELLKGYKYAIFMATKIVAKIGRDNFSADVGLDGHPMKPVLEV